MTDDAYADCTLQFAALDAERKRLDELCREIESKQVAILCNVAYKAHGIKPGVIVSVKGKKYKIDKVECRTHDSVNSVLVWKPWVTGFQMNKDGKFSTRPNNLYSDWELHK